MIVNKSALVPSNLRLFIGRSLVVLCFFPKNDQRTTKKRQKNRRYHIRSNRKLTGRKPSLQLIMALLGFCIQPS